MGSCVSYTDVAGIGSCIHKKSDTLRKVAVISNPGIATHDSSAIFKFLDKQCKEQVPKNKADFRWKLEIKDEKMGNSVYLFYELGWDDAIVLLKRGTINLILKSNEGETEYHFDPVNSDAELTYLKLSSMIGSGKILPADSSSEIKPLTLAGTRYIDFLIPGLITLGVMMSTMWGISYGIIEKRSKKLLRRLVATPMKKSHYLIALLTVRGSMNFIEALVLLLIFPYSL